MKIRWQTLTLDMRWAMTFITSHRLQNRYFVVVVVEQFLNDTRHFKTFFDLFAHLFQSSQKTTAHITFEKMFLTSLMMFTIWLITLLLHIRNFFHILKMKSQPQNYVETSCGMRNELGENEEKTQLNAKETDVSLNCLPWILKLDWMMMRCFFSLFYLL